MRLLVLSGEFPPGPGGIGSHAHAVSAWLARRGWDVRVLAPQDYASEAEVAAFNQAQRFSVVRLRHVPGSAREGLSRLRVLLSELASWRPDAMLASGERSVWCAAMATLLRPVPWVAVGHGTEFAEPVSAFRALTRWAFGRASALVSVSSYTRSRALAMGIRPRLDLVIPNGAADDLPAHVDAQGVQAFRRQHGLEGADVLLTVGNVTRRKGQDIVIRALPRLLRERPEARYLVVGLPTLKAQFAALAESLGVADRVRFLGRVDRRTLALAYSACDVFVMTSRHLPDGDFEGYGIAAVEAAMFGKPAVVSDGSGLREAVLDGETGLVVPEDDPEATAAALARVLTDDALRERLGRNARERALREQTWAVVVDSYDRVLRAVARGSATDLASVSPGGAH